MIGGNTKNMNTLIDQYKLVHENKSSYGTTSIRYWEEVSLFIKFLDAKTVLDFGCGKGFLLNKLKKDFPDIKFVGYDPAIPEISILPNEKFDLVINTDVLEHIPEKELPKIISLISSYSKNAFFVLHHAKAVEVLPNGENAHCTIKPPKWYHNLFKNYFNTLYPLTSHQKVLSAVLTFDIPDNIFLKYMELLNRSEHHHKPINERPSLENELIEIKNKVKEIETEIKLLKKKNKPLRRLFHIRYWKNKFKNKRA